MTTGRTTPLPALLTCITPLSVQVERAATRARRGIITQKMQTRVVFICIPSPVIPATVVGEG